MTRKRNSNNVMMVVSIGLFIILINLIALFFGNETQLLSSKISLSFKWNELIITYNQLWQFLVSFIIILMLLVLLRFTKLGITIRGLRDDPLLLTVYGANIFRTRGVLFFLSGIIAGIISGLVSYDVGFDPDAINYEGTDLEKKVTNKDTLRKQWAEYIEMCYKDAGGQLPTKTIVFAITHKHALRLEETFNEMYPEHRGLLARTITSKTERAKDLRRNSTDPADLFYVHIGGMDAFARALIVADNILQKSDYKKIRAE